MTEAKTNKVENVSDGLGVDGGYLFRAPIGSNKPTDIKTALDPAFKCCGFVSEDGLTFETESDREEIKDMNGMTIHSAKSSHTETMVATLAEVKRDVLAIMYGENNVTDANGIVTAHIKGADAEHAVYVAELVLKNGRRWRRVVHDAQATELSEMAVKAGELLGREATFTCFPDAETGDYYTDFIESTETEGAA